MLGIKYSFVFLLGLLRIFVRFRSFTFVLLLGLGIANTLFFEPLRLSIIEYFFNVLIIKNNKAVNMLKTTPKPPQKMTGRRKEKRNNFLSAGFAFLLVFVYNTLIIRYKRH